MTYKLLRNGRVLLKGSYEDCRAMWLMSLINGPRNQQAIYKMEKGGSQ